MSSKRYNRKSTSITISVFYENYQLGKYNMNPEYQRDDNVWETPQKSFLIDTILKNFPMPPIFLEQRIEQSTGKTTYDVIDGKQRLSTIVAFIEGNVSLPNTFGNDEYGYEKINGKNFSEIQKLAKDDENISDFVADFWSYTISVEYIERPDAKVVDNIFDRLNREGTRLNAAELRKAKYYDSILYATIFDFRDDTLFTNILSKLNKNRLQDLSFITEIAILLIKKQIIDGTESSIDEVFDDIVDKFDDDSAKELISKMNSIEEIVAKFDLDYEKYSISGVSHLYAIFYLAYHMLENDIPFSAELKNTLNSFFADLRGDRKIENTQNYHKSMQSASKYKASRKKRIKALLDYMGFENEI